MVLIRPETLAEENGDIARQSSYKLKTPKRVLHFSDGTLEEYSTDEEDNAPSSQALLDPTTLPWGPWMLYKTWAAGSSTLSFIDYLGEALASFFGITTPRYYFELEEYKRRQANEQKHADQEQGWCDTSNAVVSVPLQSVNANAEFKPINESI